MGERKFQRPLLLGGSTPFAPQSVRAIQEQLGVLTTDDNHGDDSGENAGVFSVRRQRPTPSEDWLNKVVLVSTTRREYICQNEPFRTTEPSATWASLVDYYTSGDADLHIFTRTRPELGASDVGRYYYDTYDNTFYRAEEPTTGEYRFRHVGAAEALREVCHAYFAANEGGELPGDDTTRVIYLGEAHDDDDATDILVTHTTFDISTEYAVFLNFISNEFEILSAYTPVGTLIDHFVWNPAKAEAFNPILRPSAGNIFPEPDEELFQRGIPLIDRFGHGWGVQSVLHPGEEERAFFTPINSSPHDSASIRGYENPPGWASGTEYKVGDRVASPGNSPNSVATCLQDHTSTTGGARGEPDDENTGSEAYWSLDNWADRIRVPNRSHFRGVYSRSSDVSSPQIGDWIAVPHIASGQMAFQRYSHTGGPLFGASGWFTYHPYSRVLGAFQSEADAIRAIHSFDENVRTIAMINGQLRELTYFAEHTADTHTYEWVPSRPGGNPTAVFYGRSMSATGGRWQETNAGNKEDEGNDRLLRWHETARESFFHGNALNFEFHAPSDVTGEDASVSNSDILFSPEPGLYHVELGAGANQGTSTIAEDSALGIYKVNSGTSDDRARILVTPAEAATGGAIYGEPDLQQASTARGRFIEVVDGDVFLAVYVRIASNTSQYMMWEKLD